MTHAPARRHPCASPCYCFVLLGTAEASVATLTPPVTLVITTPSAWLTDTQELIRMSSSKVDLMCAAAVAIDRANTGYDQWQRWSFFNRATKRIQPHAEGDCSSVCGAIVVLGGFPVNLNDPFYTGTFRQRLVAAGFTAERYTGRHQVKRL